MHELSLISAVIDGLNELEQKHKWGKIESVTLAVGAMRQVVPDVMLFAFETSTKDTWLQNTKLIIKEIPISYSCKTCNQDFFDDIGYICPSCNSTDVEMQHGMELEIESLEVPQ